MKPYRKIAFFTALLALSGCQTASKTGNTASAIDPETDRCGASDYQQYVGKPLSAINELRFEHPVRAIPHNSAVTMDFNLNRMNFMGDEKGNIVRIYCG